MESLYALPFSVLEPPNLRLRKPGWLRLPSLWTLFAIILCSYFLVAGGIIYDIIVEPPSIGSTTDEKGNSKPVAFMPYRINGQYIMEGLASSFMFSMGGIGFMILENTAHSTSSNRNKLMLTCIGAGCVLIAFICTHIFMKMKLP
nr:EOG090X0H7R [Artemia franciscana]